MRIKSYFANAVETAIRQAQEELGTEAMLIESRAARIGAKLEGVITLDFGDAVGPLKRVADLRNFALEVIPDSEAARNGDVRNTFTLRTQARTDS